MTARFQGPLVDPETGCVKLSIQSKAERPADAIDYRGMIVSPEGVVYGINDTGQPRISQDGIAIDAATGLTLIGSGPVVNIAMGGLGVNAAGAVVPNSPPDVIHQGVGITNLSELCTSGVASLIAFAADSTGAIKALLRGQGVTTFARSSEATVKDFEGMVKTAIAHEIRFEKARRVENLFTDSTNSLAVSASTTAVTVGVGTFVFSMGAGGGTATFSGTATGSTGTLDADASSRTAKTLTITGAGTVIVTAGVAALVDFQLENVTGQANQNPGDYVSAGVATGPNEAENGDFSSDPLSDPVQWANIANTTLSWTGSSLVFTATSNGTKTIRSTFVGPGQKRRVGKTYLVRLRYRQTVDFSALGYRDGFFRVYSESVSLLGQSETVALSDTYQTLELAVAATDGTFLIYVYASNGGSANDEFEIDDVTIEECDHGAFVDGVAYFAHENGNTVASNVVTEAKGAAITDWWALFEPAATNYTDTNNSLSTAETVDLTSGGTGDYTLSVEGTAAVTVAAGTATGTGFGQATEGNPVTFNLTGAGTVTLTLDSGTLATSQNGDYLKQIEKGSIVTSFVASPGVGNTTRTADDGTEMFQRSGNFDETNGMIAGKSIVTGVPLGQAPWIGTRASNPNGVTYYAVTDKVRLNDGTTQSDAQSGNAFVSGEPRKWAGGWGQDNQMWSGMATDDSWTFGNLTAFDGAMPADANISVMNQQGATNPFPVPVRIKEMSIYNKDAGPAWIEANY